MTVASGGPGREATRRKRLGSPHTIHWPRQEAPCLCMCVLYEWSRNLFLRVILATRLSGIGGMLDYLLVAQTVAIRARPLVTGDG